MAQHGPPPSQKLIYDSHFVNLASGMFSTATAIAYNPGINTPKEAELLRGMLQMSLIFGFLSVFILNGSRMFRHPTVSVHCSIYYGADTLVNAALRVRALIQLCFSNDLADGLEAALVVVTILAFVNALVSLLSALFS